MKKIRIGDILRDFALVVLTFMPALFSYGLVLFVCYSDPVFSLWSGRIVAPLISAFVVVFYAKRYKRKFKLLQALLLFGLAYTCGRFLPIDGFIDPTKEAAMGPVFAYVGMEVVFLFVGKVVLDLLFGLFPAFANDEEEEVEVFMT